MQKKADCNHFSLAMGYVGLPAPQKAYKHEPHLSESVNDSDSEGVFCCLDIEMASS